MSITPITSEKRYTYVGNKESLHGKPHKGLSLVIINRRGRIGRIQRFAELLKTGFDEIISVEHADKSYDVEDLISRFPKLNFLLLDKEVSWGEAVSLAIQEAQSDYVLVLWSDTKFSSGGISNRSMEKIITSEAVCVVPEIFDIQRTELPVINVPAYEKKRLTIVKIMRGADGERTLFPDDFIGIYSKKRFLELGGFDAKIANPYWQLLDFGFRSYMQGEEIYSIAGIKVEYTTDPHVYNKNFDPAYGRFALKNLFIRKIKKEFSLPWYTFFICFFKLNSEQFSDYKEIQNWVKNHKHQFCRDAEEVIQLWD